MPRSIIHCVVGGIGEFIGKVNVHHGNKEELEALLTSAKGFFILHDSCMTQVKIIPSALDSTQGTAVRSYYPTEAQPEYLDGDKIIWTGSGVVVQELSPTCNVAKDYRNALKGKDSGGPSEQEMTEGARLN